jgi:hypothetical protein
MVGRDSLVVSSNFYNHSPSIKIILLAINLLSLLNARLLFPSKSNTFKSNKEYFPEYHAEEMDYMVQIDEAFTLNDLTAPLQEPPSDFIF